MRRLKEPLKKLVVILCLIVPVKTQIPVKNEDTNAALIYLYSYGYTSTYSENEASLRDGIKRFQNFAGLPITGQLDDATKKQMSLTRCGLRDPLIAISNNDKKRLRRRKFVHQGTSWQKSDLTWKLHGTGRTLPRDIVLVVLREAMNHWQTITNINFIELPDDSNDEPDIHIKFVEFYHDDPYPFDGPGGTLAHAFYPHNNQGLSGDVHFDDAEDYTYKSPEGRNLLWVATHELGHTLGLEHSNIRDAVMYPWYTAYKPGFTLHPDDKLGIQSLYGSRVKEGDTTPAPTTPTTTTTTPKPTPRIPNSRPCPAGTITAIYYSPYYRIRIAFKDNKELTLLGHFDKLNSLPRRYFIPEFRIPNQIDAAMNMKIGSRQQVVYFSGSSYWIYFHQFFGFSSGPHDMHSTTNNPLKIVLPKAVTKIDAVFKWKRNRRVYFFVGDVYYRFDDKNMKFDSGYPKQISLNWKGIPNNIDAAFSSHLDQKTYFIKGNQIFMFDDEYIRLKNGFPQHVGQGLYDCGGKASLDGATGSINVDFNDLAPDANDP